METQGAEFDSDGDDNQRSSSMPGSSELVHRFESVLKEQVEAINAKLDGLARAIVSVETSLGDLKRAFMPSAGRPSGMSGQSGTGSGAVEGASTLFTKTIENVFPSELISACCGAAVLYMWNALCLEERVQEVVSQGSGDAPVSSVEVQHGVAERFVKALFFSFTAKHTLKAYAELDGSDHISLRGRLVKSLLVNAASREQVTIGTPFWLKMHGIRNSQVDEFYESRAKKETAGKGPVRSTGKGRKRGREHENVLDQGDVTRSVLRALDSRLSNFLNRSREQARARLMESFWIFLLRDEAKPKLSLVEPSDEAIKDFAAVRKTIYGAEVTSAQFEENESAYTELYNSPEHLVCVQYEVQVSEAPPSGMHHSAFIRDIHKNVKTGSDGLPLACVTKDLNTYEIATQFCTAFTQTASFKKFLTRSPNAIRSIYAVALFLRQIVKTYSDRPLTREDSDEMRTKFAYLIAGETIFTRFRKVEATPKTWLQLQEIMGPVVPRTELPERGGQDDGDNDREDGSENEILEI
jgi:hypothetical protein